MKAIMADNDVGGPLLTILEIWQSEQWREIWESLSLLVVTFEEIGMPRTAADVDLWRECQRREIVLVTGNRNRRDDRRNNPFNELAARIHYQQRAVRRVRVWARELQLRIGRDKSAQPRVVQARTEIV